jgi:hypothetical protein
MRVTSDGVRGQFAHVSNDERREQRSPRWRRSRRNFSTPLTKTSHVMTMVIRGFGASMRSPDATCSSLKGTGLSLRPWLLAGWIAFISWGLCKG